MTGAHPRSRSAFSYAASLGSSPDEFGADASMEEAGPEDVVAGLSTTGVDIGMDTEMSVDSSPAELLVESITELVVGVDAAGVVELQPTTPATKTAPAMIGRSLRIGGVYEPPRHFGWVGAVMRRPVRGAGAAHIRMADAMLHLLLLLSDHDGRREHYNQPPTTRSRYANATHLRGRRPGCPPRSAAAPGPGVAWARRAGWVRPGAVWGAGIGPGRGKRGDTNRPGYSL